MDTTGEKAAKGDAMKELLISLTKKDVKMQTFRSGGKGGQNQNKRDTGVRFVHKASGATGEARDSRTQLTNKKAAFNRLVKTKTFQAWLKIKIAEKSGEARDTERRATAWVEAQMAPENLKIEYSNA